MCGFKNLCSPNPYDLYLRVPILNVKALVGAFNQEKGLVVAFSMIVKSQRTFVLSSNARYFYFLCLV